MAAQTPHQRLKSLRTIHLVMVGFLFIPGVTIYYVIKEGMLGTPDYSFAIPLQTIAIFLVPGLMALGYFFLKQGLKGIDTKLPLDQKLQRYLGLFMIRCALFEVPFLFCMIAAIITRETLFIWSMPAILLVFLLLRPSAESVAEDLQLTPGEKQQLTPI